MDKLIDDLIKLAFAEDIGDGDHTTLCCIPENAMGKSKLLIKEEGSSWRRDGSTLLKISILI